MMVFICLEPINLNNGGKRAPLTTGHEEIVRRGLSLFDEIIVAIGINSHKNYLFSLEDRLEMLRITFEDKPTGGSLFATRLAWPTRPRI